MQNRTCRKCYAALIAGENWSEGLVSCRNYLCRSCNSEKGKLHYLKHSARAAELQRKRLSDPSKSIAASELKSAYYAQNKERWAKYRQTNKAKQEVDYWHRSGKLNTWIRARAAKKGMEFDLTREWIADRMKIGECPVTGLPFDLTRQEGVRFNPFAPSVDRIDSGRGYTMDNCRLVVWIYNMAKSEWNDDVVLRFAKALAAKKQD